MSDDHTTTRTRSVGVSVSSAYPPHGPLTQERLLEISERCLLGFRPMTDEPLEEQRHRLLLTLEDRIGLLLSFLLELDPGLDDNHQEPDHVSS